MDRATEYNHNHAAAGTSAGGQFVASSSAARTTKSTGSHKATTHKAAAHKTPSKAPANVAHSARSTSRLQRTLNRLLGISLAVDGKYGPKTTAAVKQAQARLGLKQDGVATSAFLSHLAGLHSLPARSTAAEVTVPGTHEAANTKPYGNVTYADPGYQKDKKERYPLDTEQHVRSAWDYIHQAKNAALYSAQQLKEIEGRIKAAGKKLGITFEDNAKESFIGSTRTFDEIKDLVRDALIERAKMASGSVWCYVYIADITDGSVVYTCADEDDLMQCDYEIGDDQSVTLGEPVEVVRTYAPAATVRNPPAEADDDGEDDGDGAMEAVRDTVAGRVLEAKGTDADGGRVYRVRIIAYGDSKNGRRYTEAVLRNAVPLYEGARAYDHHRTMEELQTSTIAGMVGSYRDIQAESDGLYGDLHLLPSATHAAECLDSSLAAQEAGLEPSVGISHDVQCHFRPIVEGGRRLQEAVQIAAVDSADIVAKPSAGGKAVRAVAGGEPNTEEESDVPPTKADVLAAFKEATDDELAAVGLARAAESTAPTTLQRATEGEAAAERTTEATTQPKTSLMGKWLIRTAVEDAGLPVAVLESVTAALPERITEADVSAQIAGIKAGLGIVERAGLTPTVTTTVVQEAREKKVEGLDKFFAGDFSVYRSFREAVLDFTGYRPRDYAEDVNRAILRECIGDGQYDTDGRLQRGREAAERATESLSASSWNLVLGDSITRRLVAEYHTINLDSWRSIVSSIVPINDFRTQRIDRIGGYGLLPTVNQGQPYQPLTSPTNEEITYAIAKRGGTEDVTLEMIANDDVRAIARIPKKLGLAAANTIYQYVWNFLFTNPNIYDSTALFTTGHANYVNSGSGSALSQSAMSAARALMANQTGYGDTANFIRPIPRFLITGAGLEELAWQLCTSAVALPAPANTPPDSTGAANTPNVHQGLTPIVVPFLSSTTAWFVAADPNLVPTIEMGYYLGRQDPELFTQSDPTVGSVFNADKVTYKIRHIYNGNVLDFRGLVKGN